MTEHVPGDDARLPQRRHLVTEIPGPVSRELLARRERAVARGVSHVLPVFVTDAGGGVILDADGNSLIDFGSGIAVVSVGNAALRVSARVAEQAARFTHTCFMVMLYEGYVEVCEELARRTPGTHDKRTALFNSGAEAVENAVKIARHATGWKNVGAFDHAYHGRTNGPYHGADREEHAVQGQVRPVCLRSTGCRWRPCCAGPVAATPAPRRRWPRSRASSTPRSARTTWLRGSSS